MRILTDKRRLKSCKMLCRVADEPVVVLKSPPVKAGNGVEDKTETTHSQVCRGLTASQKHRQLRRGEVYLKVLELMRMGYWENKPPDEVGKYQRVPLGTRISRQLLSPGVGDGYRTYIAGHG